MDKENLFEEMLEEYQSSSKLECFYGMGSTLKKSDTGLPVNIWIDNIAWSTTKQKLKRMKFQPNKGDWADTRKFIPISIEDAPKILAKNPKLKIDRADVNMIKMFVRLNQELLIQYAEQKIGIKEFLAKMKLPLYYREDPNSWEAQHSFEPGDDIDVGASLTIGKKTYNFVWKRSKSNLNLEQHHFSHYFTRLAYAAERRVIEGQRIGKDIVYLETDDGDEGLLCSMPVEVLDGAKIDDLYYKEDDYPPLSVLLLVRQREDSNGRIRLITCYPTDNRKYIEWYSRRYYSRSRVRFDNLDLADTQSITQKNERIKKLSEQDEFKKSAEVFKSVVEDLIKEMEENLLKGYQIFTQKLQG